MKAALLLLFAACAYCTTRVIVVGEPTPRRRPPPDEQCFEAAARHVAADGQHGPPTGGVSVRDLPIDDGKITIGGATSATSLAACEPADFMLGLGCISAGDTPTSWPYYDGCKWRCLEIRDGVLKGPPPRSGL